MITGNVNFFDMMNYGQKRKAFACIGGSFFSSLDFDHINASRELGFDFYNFSSKDMNIDNVESVEEQIFSIQPEFLFINIGDTDLEKPAFDEDDFLRKFEWLLYKMHKNCKACTIVVLSIISGNPNVLDLNSHLKFLAEDCRFEFIDISEVSKCEDSCVKIYNMIKPCMRCITFADAMQYKSV